MEERALTVFPFLPSLKCIPVVGLNAYCLRVNSLASPWLYSTCCYLWCAVSGATEGITQPTSVLIAHGQGDCTWVRWSVFLSVLWTWPVRERLVTVDQLAIQYDWPRQEIFKLLLHGWRRRDGTSKCQGCILLMHANMAAKVRRSC